MTDNFSFEDDHTKFTSRPIGGIVGFMISKLGVRDEKVANIILVIIAIIMFSLAALVMSSAL
jgi:hypothetical protein